MKSAAKTLLFLFAFLVLLDLVFILLQYDDLRWFSKPLIVPTLMPAFYGLSPQQTGKRFYLVLTALFFSWCGDVLLQANELFIPGLLSFLLAHLFYIGYFYTLDHSPKELIKRWPVLVAVLAYIGLLLLYLFPHLGPLKIPVVVYSVTIGVMLLMAINTRQKLAGRAPVLFIAGAILFVLSDSVLAVNLFVIKGSELGLLVMATYAAAQYLLARGALLAQRDAGQSDTRTTLSSQ